MAGLYALDARLKATHHYATSAYAGRLIDQMEHTLFSSNYDGSIHKRRGRDTEF